MYSTHSRVISYTEIKRKYYGKGIDHDWTLKKCNCLLIRRNKIILFLIKRSLLSNCTHKMKNNIPYCKKTSIMGKKHKL